jgi:hypothetical protein
VRQVSFNELKVLELQRRRMAENGELAAAQGAGKLAARAEGRSSSASWRAPLRGMRLDSNALDPPATSAARGFDGTEATAPVAPAGAAEEELEGLEAQQEMSGQVLSSLYPPDEL